MDQSLKRPILPPNGPVLPLEDPPPPPSAMIQPPIGPIVLTDEVQKLIDEIADRENLHDREIEVSEASEKGDNYMGQLLRVRINDKKQQKSQNFIVKNAPNHPMMRKMMPVELLYKRETAAYKTILPALYKVQVKYRIPIEERFTVAKFYGCNEELEKESIVLEDLSVEGYKMYSRKIPFDRQHLELVIRTLARFHATSFVLKKTHPKQFQELSNLVSKDIDFADGFEEFTNAAKSKCLSMVRDPDIQKRADARLGNLIETWRKYIIPENTEPYNVICHGDCWINNFLFKYENDRVKEMKLIDFQIIRLASPITDLAYMIFSGTDELMRANYYASSLDLYYRTMDANITRMGHKTHLLYPKAVFENQIKSVMPMGLLAGCMLIPMMLANKEDVPDMETLSENPDVNMYDNLMSKACQDRIDGVAKDCAAYGFI